MTNTHVSDLSIALLSVLNNLDTQQWVATFPPAFTLQTILPFLYQSAKASTPLLKAASIKMLGYMVYFDMSTVLAASEANDSFKSKVY